jgi:hypothetical protein
VGRLQTRLRATRPAPKIAELADLAPCGFRPTPPITVNSHWQHKKTSAEVIVTRVTFREVSYMALDKTFSGPLSQWLFLQDFQPVTERKKKSR